MISILLRVLVPVVIIVAVSEVAQRMPRVGALLLSLPLVSVLAFIMTWTKTGEMGTLIRLARETLILVPLGLPFFLPFAVANNTGLSFWPTFGLGVLLASCTVGTWLILDRP